MNVRNLSRYGAFSLTAVLVVLGTVVDFAIGDVLVDDPLGWLGIPNGHITTFLMTLFLSLAIYALGVFLSVLYLRWLSPQSQAAQAVAELHVALYGPSRDWRKYFALPLVALLVMSFPLALHGELSPIIWSLSLLLLFTIPPDPTTEPPGPVSDSGDSGGRPQSSDEEPRTEHLTVAELLERLRSQSGYHGQLGPRVAEAAQLLTDAVPVSSIFTPGSPAAIVHPFGGNDEALLYSHQHEIWDLLQREDADGHGPAVGVLTPVSTGRWTVTLCAILDRVLARGGTVLVVAPGATKCEGYFQHLKALLEESHYAWALNVQALPSSVSYSAWEDDEARVLPQVLFTTAEVLHRHLAPKHMQWSVFLSQLDLVVGIDADRWNGTYGANVACVFRRVFRLCEHLGARPRIMAITRPSHRIASFLTRLFHAEFTEDHMIRADGAPRTAQWTVYWNPPPARFDADDPSTVPPRPVLDEATDLLVSLNRARREPVLYASQLPYTTGDLRPLRQQVGRMSVPLIHDVSDLGAPVSEYDTMVLCGTPDIPLLLDHAARHLKPRNSDASLVMIVPTMQPLPQFLMRCMQDRALPEKARFDIKLPIPAAALSVSNAEILRKHLLAAAAERQLSNREIKELFGSQAVALAESMAATDLLTIQAGERLVEGRLEAERRYVITGTPPSRGLRTATDSVVPLETRDGAREVGSVDELTVNVQAYPGAVLVIGDVRYQVDRPFELAEGDAVGLRVTTEMISQPIRSVKATPAPDGLLVAGLLQFGQGIQLTKAFGRIRVDVTTSGFRIYSEEALNGSDTVVATEPYPQDAQRVSSSFATEGLVLGFGDAKDKADPAVLHSLVHLFRIVLPLMVLCDADDVGIDYEEASEVFGQKPTPAIVLYDSAPGGTGVAQVLGDNDTNIRLLFLLSYWCLATCACTTGCNACLHTIRCSGPDANGNLDKQATLRLLSSILHLPNPQEVKDEYVLRRIQQRMIDIMRTRLGMDFVNPGSIRFFSDEEAGQRIDGFYDPTANEIAIRKASYERTLAVIAHEVAHNWQHEANNMDASLMDSSLPYDGRMFIEGFAEWVQYHVLDFMGLFRGLKDQSLLHNDPYGAGVTVLRWVERQEGVSGVFAFMQKEWTREELESVWHKAGVTDKMLQEWDEAKSRGEELPSFDWVGGEAHTR